MLLTTCCGKVPEAFAPVDISPHDHAVAGWLCTGMPEPKQRELDLEFRPGAHSAAAGSRTGGEGVEGGSALSAAEQQLLADFNLFKLQYAASGHPDPDSMTYGQSEERSASRSPKPSPRERLPTPRTPRQPLGTPRSATGPKQFAEAPKSPTLKEIQAHGDNAIGSGTVTTGSFARDKQAILQGLRKGEDGDSSD